MIQTFVNAWKVQELRKKILFTLMILLLYRIGANLFIPYVSVDAISGDLSNLMTNGIFGLISMMSGGAFSRATFFALGVSPYITASIVIQLLSIAIPALERLSKDEDGKKKLSAATRWVTVVLAIITAYGYVNIISRDKLLTVTSEDKHYVLAWFVMIACLCAGASMIMWLAEKINEHGIGNGISMILFANIISGMTNYVLGTFGMLTTYSGNLKTGWDLVLGILGFILSIALTLGAIVLIVWFTNSERRIKVIYAKKVVGRKTYGGQKTNLPLKMNMAGVMPVIFASSIVSIPATIAGFLPEGTRFKEFLDHWLGVNTPIYIFVFIALTVAFSYFYIAISFNPVEVANNIRSNGGAIIGIRPQEMAPFIKKILNRVTLMGAIFLVIIAGVPMIFSAVASLIPGGSSFTSVAFTGTSLLIAVGVALETVRDLEAQLSMRNYKGFLD